MITEESFIDFKCPYCGEPVSFPQPNAGSPQECPLCAETVIVPKVAGEPGRKVPIPITTARLSLRRLRAGDWKELLEFLSSEESFEFTDRGPMDEQEIIHWLETDNFVRLTTPDQTFYLGIEVQAGGKLVGFVNVKFADQQRLQADFNVVVSPSYQRNGVATEAVGGLLDFCFNEIALHRLQAWFDSRNVAACGLCEKLGLRREGEFLKDRQVKGEWINTVWYARLDEEHRDASRGILPEGAIAAQGKQSMAGE